MGICVGLRLSDTFGCEVCGARPLWVDVGTAGWGGRGTIGHVGGASLTFPSLMFHLLKAQLGTHVKQGYELCVALWKRGLLVTEPEAGT